MAFNQHDNTTHNYCMKHDNVICCALNLLFSFKNNFGNNGSTEMYDLSIKREIPNHISLKQSLL